MNRLDEEIARIEREAAAGLAAPDRLTRLAQLYLRAGRAADAHEALRQARAGMTPLIRTEAGEVAGLDPLWEELTAELEAVEGEQARVARDERRRALLRLLEAGSLGREGHDELIRLEVQDGLALHPEQPACPACAGPVGQAEPTARDVAEVGLHELKDVASWVRCARSGSDGDLCRHVDARGLMACGRCGLVVRAWKHGRLEADPREPPLAVVERARCSLCGGAVVSWTKHFMNCPQGRPGDFPRCPVCRRRGFHRRGLSCPRCAAVVGEASCLEPPGGR